MVRVFCDLCRNVISEAKGGGRAGMGMVEFHGGTTFEMSVETPGERVVIFSLCGSCATRLASALKRGVLEPSDLPDLPEETGNG